VRILFFLLGQGRKEVVNLNVLLLLDKPAGIDSSERVLSYLRTSIGIGNLQLSGTRNISMNYIICLL